MIATRFPPIDLFDDVADPADWGSLPRRSRGPIRGSTRSATCRWCRPARLAGPGASWVMRRSPALPRSRCFSDGGYGIYYAGERGYRALRTPATWVGSTRRPPSRRAGSPRSAVFGRQGPRCRHDRPARRRRRPGSAKRFRDLLDRTRRAIPRPSASQLPCAHRGRTGSSTQYGAIRAAAASRRLAGRRVGVGTGRSRYRYHWNGERGEPRAAADR